MIKTGFRLVLFLYKIMFKMNCYYERVVRLLCCIFNKLDLKGGFVYGRKEGF